MIVSKEEYDSKLEELSKSCKIIEENDLIAGLKGFVAIKFDKGKRQELQYSYRFSVPITKIVEVKDNADHLFRECVSKEDTWISCDNEKERKVGFLNYSKSEARFFSQKALSGIDQQLVKRFVSPRQRTSVRI